MDNTSLSLDFGELPADLRPRGPAALCAQALRLLEHLRRGPAHTHQLRRAGISHPAGRVQDLLRAGYVIESSRVTTVDSDGYLHAGVALYWLVGESESKVDL